MSDARPHVSLLHVGEQIVLKGATATVTVLDVRSTSSVRDHLISIAQCRGTTTYSQLKSELRLPHAVNGLGRLLDLVSEECRRRGEPSLAALVVTTSTGEVGSGADPDAGRRRRAVYAHWADIGRTPDRATEFVLNGTRRRLSTEIVDTCLSAMTPEVVRTHWVEIAGRRWPPKQVLRAALGLARGEPFISHFAIRVFRRLGYATSTLPDEVAVPVAAPISSYPLAPAQPVAHGVLPTDSVSSISDEDAALAFRALDAFLAAAPLTSVLSALEERLLHADGAAAAQLALNSGFDEDLVDSALVVRERVGMLDTLIHAAVITQVIPLLLEDGETVIKRPSLGAGNDPERVFDLETNRRVAEFKLSSWKGADSGRQRSLFADVVGLSLDESGRRREVYVVGPKPQQFLTASKRNALRTLSKSSLRVRQPRGMSAEMTVSAFTAAAKVHVVDLMTLLPRLR